MNALRGASWQPRRRALTALGVLVVMAVLITAVLSPGVIAVLDVLGIAGASFDDVTIRTLQLVAIALTALALLCSGGGGKTAWGIPARGALVRRLGLGFVCGLLSLAAVCVLLILFEVRVVRADLPVTFSYWLSVLASAMLSAVAVGVLEELWFRGGLFTLLCRGGGVAMALVGGSVLYAAVHFLVIPGGLDASASPHWSGMQVLEAATLNMFRVQHLDSFVALLIAGMTLALVRLRHGDVAMCIGIHAGWVLTIKVFKKLTHLSPLETNRILVGQYDGVIGWVAAACLAIMLVLVWRFLHQPTVSGDTA